MALSSFTSFSSSGGSGMFNMHFVLRIAKALCFTSLLSHGAKAAPAHSSANNLKVETSSGTVYGAINGTVPGVIHFLGIPYAQPPVGALRWLPPASLNASHARQIVDATNFSPSCPQYAAVTPNLFNRIVPEFLINGPTSEDCLSLSMWTPAAPSPAFALLPVFIFIHGGAFQIGGSSVPYENPAKWIQRTQGHIVISIQYRLNLFGFPNAPGLTTQNLGLLDQRMAIEWIHSNIASFGGDPEKMILWGQSAGAESVDAQNYAFPSNPIVKGFISDSGSALLISSSSVSYDSFNIVASHFNCALADPAETLSCMRDISSLNIETFLKSFVDAGTSPGISFNPTADNVTVFSNYTQKLLDRKISNAPAIFGSNSNEGVFFAPFPEDPDTNGPNATLAEAALLNFICPSVRTSMLRQQVGLPTYRYQYRGNFTNVSPKFWMGAYHSAELPLIFGTSGDFRGADTSFEAAVSTVMQDVWLSFALNPNSPLLPNFSEALIEVFGGVMSNGLDVSAQLVQASDIDSMCSAS